MEKGILDVNKLNYPVLGLFNPGILVYEDAESLSVTTAKAVRLGQFDDVFLVDCQSFAYRVVGAQIRGPVGRFWGYDVFLDRNVFINLLYDSQMRSLAINEVIDLVETRIDAMREIWESGMNYPEFRRSIRAARNVKELAELLY